MQAEIPQIVLSEVGPLFAAVIGKPEASAKLKSSASLLMNCYCQYLAQVQRWFWRSISLLQLEGDCCLENFQESEVGFWLHFYVFGYSKGLYSNNFLILQSIIYSYHYFRNDLRNYTFYYKC